MCAREKLCWVDADEMPTEKELINALGKPIVPKLIEKLKKCRTDKGKTVSSIEICDNCDVELECLVLESIDLNIQPSTKQNEETKVMIEYGEGDHYAENRGALDRQTLSLRSLGWPTTSSPSR